MKKNLLFLLLLSGHVFAADTTVIKSPDGIIQFKLFLQGNAMSFAVYYKNIPVVEPSPIIATLDNAPVTSNVKLSTMKQYKINEQFPWMGVHSTSINHCNGAKIRIQGQKTTDSMDVRVFNNGIAFRLVFPGSPGNSRVPDEATVFTLPRGSYLWYHDMEMHYEGVHVKKEISQVQSGEWVAPPATYKLPQGLYASVTEADLKDYSGMALQSDGKNGLVMRLAHNQRPSYPYRLRYSPEDTLRLMQPAAIKGTIITPWRVVMIGADLNTLVNADIIQDLCPPADPSLFPKGLSTSWIKPGRAVWKYLDGGGDGTPEIMKKFTDGAAALGFEHNILEGFWTKWSDEQLKDLVDYSRKKGVGIWLWMHSKSLRTDSARQAFFKHCHDLGITGAKIDFFDHEAKEVIDLYSSILREAAQYHLLLDFHGANKPTGQFRTWPNELTMESVKGMEASRLMDRATHETTIPFTRLLAGPAEYTVMLFGDRRRNTTWAHQVASAAILSAPMLTYAANPQNILANPAVEVIKNIPCVWDETIVLPGSEIGELAIYARRKGTTWFLAVMNGTQGKQVKIPLRFLKSGTYKTTIVSDDPANPAAEIVKQATYTSNDVIELELISGGGYIAQFKL